MYSLTMQRHCASVYSYHIINSESYGWIMHIDKNKNYATVIQFIQFCIKWSTRLSSYQIHFQYTKECIWKVLNNAALITGPSYYSQAFACNCHTSESSMRLPFSEGHCTLITTGGSFKETPTFVSCSSLVCMSPSSSPLVAVGMFASNSGALRPDFRKCHKILAEF